jgi:beta-lactam-binding protein with PASTA domain
MEEAMKMMKAATLGLGTIAVAALVAGCGATQQASAVVTPNLIGKSSVSAQKLLADRGLRWRWEDGAKPVASNGFFIADTIEGQSPSVGQHVKSGTVVMLVPNSDKYHVITPLG